jgi:hypothetical protein
MTAASFQGILPRKYKLYKKGGKFMKRAIEFTSLRKMLLRPKRHENKDICVNIYPGHFAPVDAEIAEALGLTLGDAIFSVATVEDSDAGNDYLKVDIFAQGEAADKLLDLEKDYCESYFVRAKLVFGVHRDFDWTDDGGISRAIPISGLHILEILSVNINRC